MEIAFLLSQIFTTISKAVIVRKALFLCYAEQ